jgi:hypothetical protein
MELSNQSSAFLRLPAEVRNQIYAYILSGEAFSIHCWRRYAPFGIATRILRKQKNFLALLAVCHQIHAETRLLPFQLNAFRFKSQDAFKSWLDKFGRDQKEAIQEVHIVTWMARHMVEGESWMSKSLDAVFPVDSLFGLRRVEVEVRTNGRMGDCIRDGCFQCSEHGDEAGLEEERFRGWLVGHRSGIKVTFERVMA